METALVIAISTSAVVWLSFSFWYMLRAKWWKNPFGWNTLGVSLVLTTIFTRLAFLVAFPEAKADLRVTGLVLYTMSAIFGAHRLFLLERAQRGQGPLRRVTDQRNPRSEVTPSTKGE